MPCEDIAGTGLDSSSTRPVELPSTGSGAEECRERTGQAKTDVVVPIVRIVPVPIRRAAVPRVVVPGATPQQLWEPAP